MGLRILHDREQDLACLYCSTSDVAFGPVFCDGDEHGADERAEAFTRYLKRDARQFTDSELIHAYNNWLTQETDQWKREAAEEEATNA